MAASPRRSDEESAPCERDRLLGFPSPENDWEASEGRVQTRVAMRLYVSHFLSTWNSRVFEFGAVLYLATIYPGTLLPMSLYAFARGVSAIVFAPAVGQYIDTGDRLRVVRVSIVSQRAVVAASCVIFYVLARGLPLPGLARVGMLVLISLFACVEKLGSIMNTVSVEKDWVVVVAGRQEATLRHMNAQMRRIDLLCKIFGPLFIALIDGVSTEAAILVNVAMNVASVGVEYFAIARVYYDVVELQQPKRRGTAPETASEAWEGERERDTSLLGRLSSRLGRAWKHVQATRNKTAADVHFYFHHRVFLPSMAGALLYLTVLSFSGQMVTYLLSVGYSATQIGLARTLSVVFEMLATWVAPWLMGRIGPVRAGLWLSSWQAAMLVAGMAVFLGFADTPIISASGLVGGTILSRVGLRGFDLCAQLLVQEEVEAENRGAFSTIEAAWQNAFELLSYTSTMMFFRPEQFRWPALISATATVLANLAYTVFVYQRRGHLVHTDVLASLWRGKKGPQSESEEETEPCDRL